MKAKLIENIERIKSLFSSLQAIAEVFEQSWLPPFDDLLIARTWSRIDILHLVGIYEGSRLRGGSSDGRGGGGRGVISTPPPLSATVLTRSSNDADWIDLWSILTLRLQVESIDIQPNLISQHQASRYLGARPNEQMSESSLRMRDSFWWWMRERKRKKDWLIATISSCY